MYLSSIAKSFLFVSTLFNIFAYSYEVFESTTHGMGGFDWTSGNISLYHSESAYCDPNSYLTRTYKGPLAGFVPTYSIYDAKYDTRGYIGYATSHSTIYVVFRGSSSIQNWLSDLDAVLTPYPLCSDCNVHKGFYVTEQSCYSNVLTQVKNLKSKYPNYSVIVTGHSLG
jgi:hypothetical protein